MANKRTLLIDGDIIAFRSVSAHYHQIEWEPNLWTYHVDMASAKAAMHSQVDRLQRETDTDDVVVCLTGTENFRVKLLPTYKGHRKQKPPGYREFQEWVQENFRSYLRPGLEGDDILGILMTHPTIVPGEKIIWSADKDLAQIPGLHWKDGKVLRRTHDDLQRVHATQTLTGDTTDNYKGCPGWGPAKVVKFFKEREGHEWGAIWNGVENAFLSAGLTREDFLVQARCARILTYDLYDFNKKEPILWTPPTPT